ncbi:hypothetical protein [Pseudomonas cichorii]|uniref:hypothetical protein n=1 Tax=Pseudomonas cichorii TaxID=36746 RepID=UPI001C89242A|nr:hypothetical protein [Pseudomonas cichorii]MBX8484653.1 hypothetical protein [Pseudomonas cichorii]MBX8496371.1 hypothetical protein [Pseudomonas cichorii]
MSNATPLAQASSTPSTNRDGQVATVKLAKLSTYEVNIRSFHPGKTFGWSGFNFEGDARGFSLKPSGLSGVPGTLITSRIWHKFFVNLSNNEVTGTQTESNDSGKAGAEHTHYDAELKPKGGSWPSIKTEKGATTTVWVDGGYAGENHAFPLSAKTKKLTGITFVPSLDVSYKIIMTLDRVAKHLDVVTYITGDGFPNCEAFISDPVGKPIFLGVHVRKGAAAVSLFGDKKFPMIASAIRIEVDDDGNFKDKLGNEMRRRKLKKEQLEMRPIDEWNNFFTNLSPNDGRWMDLWEEPMPDSNTGSTLK